MSSKKNVMYYNMPGDLDYERGLLKQWGITDLELTQVQGNDIVNDVKDADSLTLEYTQVNADTLKRLPKLKIIALQSIGFNEIDINAADEQGIYVTNTPGFCAYEVASHVMALLLNISRQISFYDNSVKAGQWQFFHQAELFSLRDKTCGLVSMGSIPQELIPMLKGFGINVVFYSPSKTDDDAKKLGITRCASLSELLSVSDIVSLHTPLFPETENMIGDAEFAQMKDGAILINTARGELIDEQALAKNLKSKKILAAGLDVLADEHNHNSELIGMDNVIITPHVGFYSKESLIEARKISLEQIVMRLSNDMAPICAVNKNIQALRA